MGRTPKLPGERRNRAVPLHEWEPTTAIGWQHGQIPRPPPKLTPAARLAWRTWFGAWFASHWGPGDVPGLRQVIRLYDQVERGALVRHAELRVSMDGYGITPKGQLARRWLPPTLPAVTAKREASGRYAHLRVIPDQPSEEP